MVGELEPTSDCIGVAFRDIQLRAVTDHEWSAVARALSEHGLLIFRDQSLSREEQVALAHRLGRIDEFDTRVPNASPTPFVARPPGIPVITEISNVDNKTGDHLSTRDYPQTRSLGLQESWRSDGSFKNVPVKASILAAVEVDPRSVGETQFADMQAAFEALSEQEQRQLEALSAWHSAVYVKAARGEVPLKVAADPTTMTGAAHCVVITVPGSGQKALYIGENACCIVGMEVAEGQALLEQIRATSCNAPHVYTHQWRAGDVVIWDSRRFLHRTMPWDLAYRRSLRHISVAGDA